MVTVRQCRHYLGGGHKIDMNYAVNVEQYHHHITSAYVFDVRTVS